jgi:hypothetical protein
VRAFMVVQYELSSSWQRLACYDCKALDGNGVMAERGTGSEQ